MCSKERNSGVCKPERVVEGNPDLSFSLARLRITPRDEEGLKFPEQAQASELQHHEKPFGKLPEIQI
jgi:hypothetical protein